MEILLCSGGKLERENENVKLLFVLRNLIGDEILQNMKYTLVLKSVILPNALATSLNEHKFQGSVQYSVESEIDTVITLSLYRQPYQLDISQNFRSLGMWTCTDKAPISF
ncbi:hypothetical protein DICVIV_10598 [Dictyocaulus viviparus]|uniref:Uncharacterized protein n=1 Tax=Dictyocaulus viviparus TaxID=29172 RepID=A0A0D8XI33_DICVI|nr:hypothetical protein DICVIV_10598 [Dictyocaulus viviparus]